MITEDMYEKDFSTGEIIDILVDAPVGTKALMIGSDNTMILRDEGGVVWNSSFLFLEGNLYTLRRRWRLLKDSFATLGHGELIPLGSWSTFLTSK